MTKYTEKDISGFKRDLDKIRAKPSLYIGPTDNSGIFTILREPCDNAVDEARAGRNKVIEIILTDEAFYIRDEGVGIPVKKHATMGISTLTHVVSNLQSSGKMKGDAYSSAIGTHGVGIKATNALSAAFQVWTFRKDSGGWFTTAFASGAEKIPAKKAKLPSFPTKSKIKNGTIIKFTPDPKIFGKAKLDVKQVRAWAEMTAYMNSGLKIILNVNGKTEEWLAKDGIKTYLDKRIVDLKATPISKKILQYTSANIEMAMAFTDVEGCEVEVFTNTIRNIEEGVHAEALYKALFDSLKLYKGKSEFTPSDIKEGVIGIFNYKINAPQFDSQTKEKLVDVRVKEPALKELNVVFGNFWKENKALAKQVCERAAELRKKTADFLKDKKLSRNVKQASKTLVAKLAGVVGSCPLEDREIYLVEGDSAGGTAKLARFKDYQAVFSLKGKPLNVMEATKDKVNSNAEIASVFAGIGIDPSAKNPLGKLSFGKIVFLADPDVDGSHINALLMGLFWRYTPSLYRDGKIFMVASPEYMTEFKGGYVFGDTKEEVWKKVGSDKVNVLHIKGWGEIEDGPMRDIAFKKGVRRLYRIDPPRDKKGIKSFEAMLGKDSTYRKQMLGLLPMTPVKGKN